MAAITAAPTPPKSSLGEWVAVREALTWLVAEFANSSSDGTTSNTVAETQTFVAAVIAALEGAD